MDTRLPIVQSMILADYVHRDSMTQKKLILGTYNNIVTSKFPYPKPALNVYLAITNTHGPTVLCMRIIDVDDQQAPIHESAYPVELSDPNQVYEMTFSASVVFPYSGHYRVQLLAGGELLRECSRRHPARDRPIAQRSLNEQPGGGWWEQFICQPAPDWLEIDNYLRCRMRPASGASCDPLSAVQCRVGWPYFPPASAAIRVQRCHLRVQREGRIVESARLPARLVPDTGPISGRGRGCMIAYNAPKARRWLS